MEKRKHSDEQARLSREQLVRQFDEQGYIILKDVFDMATIQGVIGEMRTLVDRHADKLLAEGKIGDLLKDAPFETRLHLLYRDHLEAAPKSFRTELHLPGLYPLFFNPRLLDAVELFIGDEIRLYPNYTARPKLPDWEGTLVLWHQDAGYTENNSGKQDSDTSINDFRMVNVWAPLVPARPENGCMQFIPGTHKLGVVRHEHRTHYLEIAEDVLRPRLQEAIDVVLDPGDVVLFNNLLFHCGQPNRSGTIRWSVDWRYQDLRQPTNRQHQGHVARSRSHPDESVRSAEEWAALCWK
ncbi:MAG: hypothetical protein K0Q59_225 [Paenibacillus sp.]|jgi:ectoine hydroxylase-related dioxygenase (phytanoyl-CoA dioxygenase family)|nr:hypothetical protein [Paenibacillus sp.]